MEMAEKIHASSNRPCITVLCLKSNSNSQPLRLHTSAAGYLLLIIDLHHLLVGFLISLGLLEKLLRLGIGRKVILDA